MEFPTKWNYKSFLYSNYSSIHNRKFKNVKDTKTQTLWNAIDTIIYGKTRNANYYRKIKKQLLVYHFLTICTIVECTLDLSELDCIKIKISKICYLKDQSLVLRHKFVQESKFVQNPTTSMASTQNKITCHFTKLLKFSNWTISLPTKTW